MKAWRWYALGDMRLDDVPFPEARPGWVVVKVKVVQPSVTEAQASIGLPSGDTAKFKKMLETQAPVRVFGHELCAEIVETGKGVEGLKIGDRVSARGGMPCYQCELCRTGQSSLCHKGPKAGLFAGGFSEYTTLPASLLVVLPSSVTDSEGAAMQPAGAAVSCVLDARIALGDSVVVLGQGCMGSYIMQVSKACGATSVIAVDIRDNTLSLSARLGADEVIDARKVDPVERTLELTRGLGANIVFEAAGGSPEAGLAGHKTLLQAFDLVRDNGRVVQVALHGVPVPINVDYLRQKGIDYVMPKGAGDASMQLAVQLVEKGQLRLEPLITHVLHGLDKAAEAFEMTLNKGQYGAINPVQVVVSQ